MNQDKTTVVNMVKYAIDMMKWCAVYYEDKETQVISIRRWWSHGTSVITIAMGLHIINNEEANKLDSELEKVYNEYN